MKHAPGPRAGDNTVLAILLCLLALLFFDLMGLVIKHLSPRYSAAELSAYRNVFGLVPSFIALYASAAWRAAGRRFAIRQWKLGLFRGLLISFAQLMFYGSLAFMPFATASTLSYASAIFACALAWPLLGERVGPLRWLAVGIGFAGVVFVIGPSSEAFGWAALMPLGAAALYATTAITARLFDDDVVTPLVNVYSAGCALVGSVILALFWGGFSPLQSWTDLAWIALMGGFGGVAVLLYVMAYRMTEQSNLAPFSYFGIPMAFVLGWAFYDEAPWGDLFPGALLIAAGGLFIVWRERRLSLSRSASQARGLATADAPLPSDKSVS
ncbi:DMT family transporter [Lentibacter sp. XHP0401]|jgi:drug/metabolite transporter (DMT)-like permease|uniref:DMT family transporter n=1 Tax=Lentibacter sp. XHP0401 TaxID=2984334 RepID=UPI0021E844FB|nr:DMT family transporter [Lentibacter sp. XHP0401]MCV2894377.1 DMT family transporter [Lentibacter sp. XHP0401]